MSFSSWRKPLGLLLSTAAFGAVFASERPAHAQNDAQTCAAAAEQAQAARDEGKYRRAREQLLVCSRDACPGPIKKDCSEWLGQIDNVAPSVVFIARDGDRDVTDVKVTMDGVSLTERLDGKAVSVDTGEHVFKFERGGVVKEEKVLVGAGQKGRTISVNFGSVVAKPPPPPGGGPDPKPVRSDSGSSMVPIYVLGGVGVLGLASFTIFGISGKSDVSDLRDTCDGHCAESDVDKARTKLIVADISLGIGVVSLGVAAYLFFTRPKETTSAPLAATAAKAARPTLDSWRFDAATLPGGGSATLSGRF